MDWNTYQKKYYEAARIKEKTENYCIHNLTYAKELFDQKLPIIYSQEHFSRLVGYSLEYLYLVSNSSSKSYKTFSIEKRNGSLREINEPLPSLKEIQEWILKEILDYIPESAYSKAYQKGKSVRDNAKFHRNQSKVLMMDLHDFFGTVNYKRVYHLFISIGYRKPVAVLLANLCCYKGHLPQGAPTSPKIANLVARTMDYKIGRYAKKRGLRYSRYADDLTISGDFDEGKVIADISHIIRSSGFVINDEKTKVRYKNQRQQVTGIVVNQTLQIPCEIRREIRQAAYYIDKYGLENHINHINEKRENYLYHLIGVTSYGLFINPHDEKLRAALEIFKSQLDTRKQSEQR